MMTHPLIRFVLLLCPPLILLVFSLYFMHFSNENLPLARESLAAKKRTIEQLNKRINHTMERISQQKKELTPLSILRTTAFGASPAQAPAVFRERVERAANLSGLKIRSMSDIRQTDLSEKIFLFELNFAADCQLAELVQFMNILYTEKPRVYWKSMTLRPNNHFNVEYLVLNAVISILCFAPDMESGGKT